MNEIPPSPLGYGQHIIVEIEFLSSIAGGRLSPVISGYRPQFYYSGRDWDAEHFYHDAEKVHPGERVRAHLRFGCPGAHRGKVFSGMPFLIREGARTVGFGAIIEVLPSLEQDAINSKEDFVMNHNEFWALIENARARCGGDDNKIVQVVQEELALKSPEDIIMFRNIFDEYRFKAYRNDLWAAAYIVNGGCSDDGFEYFRAWLIAQGQRVYYMAIADPNSLKDVLMNNPDIEVDLEAMMYVADKAYEQKTGIEMPSSPLKMPELIGDDWDEDKVEEMFPDLNEIAEQRFAMDIHPVLREKKPLFVRWIKKLLGI